MRKVGFVLADTHGGNSLGLLSPGTFVKVESPIGQIIDYELPLNPVQLFINDIFEWLLEEAKEYAGNDEVIFIHNGDLTQGGKHGQLITTSELTQAVIGAKNVQRVLDALPNCKTVRIIKGTGVHVFECGDSELAAGKILDSQNPTVNTRVMYHNLLTYNGVTFDVSHHGPTYGIRAWLTGNEARYYLRSLMMTEIMEGREPPRMVVRAHFHTYIKETISLIVKGEEVQSTIVICPSLCSLDDYARKRVKSPWLITLGGLFFETIDGQLTDVSVRMKTLDVRTKEVVNYAGATDRLIATA